MAEGQMAERTYERKTFDRKDISPKGQMVEKHEEMDILPERRLTQNTQDLKN